MEIAQNSVLLRQGGQFVDRYLALYAESGSRRFFAAAGRGFREDISRSRVCEAARREGTFSRSWEKSGFFRFLEVVLNLPPLVLQWIYAKTGGALEGSTVFRGLNFLGDRLDLLMGLFFFAMLVAPHAVWNNLYGLIGILALICLFLIWLMRRPKARVHVKYFTVYLALYGIWIIYGFASSLSRSLSLRFFLFHITCFLIVFLVVSRIGSYRQLKRLIGFALAGLTLSGLYGCYQGVVGVAVVASQADLALNAGMPGRIYSFFDNPNNFAEILVMLIPFYLAFILNAKSFRARALIIAAGLPPLASIALTYSRSGWIGLALAVLIFLAFQNWRFVPLFVLLGLTSLPFLPKTIINRILTIGNTEDTSTMYRFAIYKAVFRLLRDFWATGVGLGSDIMKRIFQNYPPMFDGNYPIHSHDNYLQIWGETGILGIVAYIAVLLAQLKAGILRISRRTCPREVRNVTLAAVSGLCGILVVGIAEYTWFYPRNMFLFWFLFAVIGAGVKLADKSAREGAAEAVGENPAGKPSDAQAR